jgi:hypothetical protein
MSALALKIINEAKEQRRTKLNLGNCGLTELPDELFELTWLEELNLSNDMSALALKLIQEAKEQRLTRLDLGNCGLTNCLMCYLNWFGWRS